VRRAVEVMVGEPSRRGVMVCYKVVPLARGALRSILAGAAYSISKNLPGS